MSYNTSSKKTGPKFFVQLNCDIETVLVSTKFILRCFVEKKTEKRLKLIRRYWR